MKGKEEDKGRQIAETEPLVAAMNREFEEEVGAGLVEFGPDDYIFSNSSRRARQETLLLVLPQDELEGIFRDSLARVLGLLWPI